MLLVLNEMSHGVSIFLDSFEHGLVIRRKSVHSPFHMLDKRLYFVAAIAFSLWLDYHPTCPAFLHGLSSPMSEDVADPLQNVATHDGCCLITMTVKDSNC